MASEVDKSSRWAPSSPRVAAGSSLPEVQVFAGSSSGLSLVQGNSQLEHRWRFRSPKRHRGAVASRSTFQPAPVAGKVTVHLRLASGPLAPFGNAVAPGETSALATSRRRVPAGASYSARSMRRVAGVVVSRAVVALPPRRRRKPVLRWRPMVSPIRHRRTSGRGATRDTSEPRHQRRGHGALAVLNVGDGGESFRASRRAGNPAPVGVGHPRSRRSAVGAGIDAADTGSTPSSCRAAVPWRSAKTSPRAGE